MRKSLLILICCLFATTASRAQLVSVHTNLVGWAVFGTINAGVEPALTPNMTFSLDGYYNPYTGEAGESTRMWGLQPEVRYWLKTKYTGHFFGIHSMYADYDYGRKLYRYDGYMTGAGVSYGYSLAFLKRWRVSANLGVGWLHKEYSKSGLPQWSDNIRQYGDFTDNCFGITKASINVSFIIR